MVYCPKCGTKNEENTKFCSSCRSEIETMKTPVQIRDFYTLIRWANFISKILAAWGVIHLFIAWQFSAILLFFAALVYASKSMIALYTFGIIWFILAVIVLVIGINNTVLSGTIFLVSMAIINAALAIYVLYKTKKVKNNAFLTI